MLPEIGTVVTGKVSGITKFGAFVLLPDGSTGLVHISRISKSFVSDVSAVLQVGQEVKAVVISTDNGRIALSMVFEEKKKESFEDMLSRFKNSSDEKIGDMRKNDRQQHKKRQ